MHINDRRDQSHFQCGDSLQINSILLDSQLFSKRRVFLGLKLCRQGVRWAIDNGPKIRALAETSDFTSWHYCQTKRIKANKIPYKQLFLVALLQLGIRSNKCLMSS